MTATDPPEFLGRNLQAALVTLGARPAKYEMNNVSNDGPRGWLYLLHLDRPMANGRAPQHYLGWTSKEDVDIRQLEHESGAGAAILKAAVKEGIGWRVVKLWGNATKVDERKKKNSGHLSRYCPICKHLAIRQQVRGKGGHYGPPKEMPELPVIDYGE